jgi:hypothetical protein
MPPFPSIIAHDYLFYPNDLIGLGGFGFNSEINTSAELQEFRQALENAGFLREGITVEMLNLERKNTTTLKYTIRVTNNDKENIYVLDPNKMGVGRFHYFTNGVTVRKNEVSYYSEIESIASDEIKTSWYYMLGPQKSMDRTVELNGFTNLPTGNVHFRFSFPGSKVEKGEWKKSDGRIWLGQKYIEGDFELN